jgi:hypothetical protein
MKVASFVLGLTIAAGAGAQNRVVPQVDREQFVRDMQHVVAVMSRANLRVPKRRDSPLRELNITDEEIREIQAATKPYLPPVYLNISPVVTGCACEDGPDCKEQVYVLADTGKTAKGLQLSRIKNAWTVGSLQQWWLNLGRLEERRARMEYAEFERAMIALAHEYPMCDANAKPQATPPTAQASPPKK